MTELRRAILEALDLVGRDRLVLSLLLMMREEEIAAAFERFANAHPEVQAMILETICALPENHDGAANENDRGGQTD